MGISFTNGIKSIGGAVKDVVEAPLELATGDVDGVVEAIKAPMRAKKGLIETAAGAVINPAQGAARVLTNLDKTPAGQPSPSFVHERTGRIVV